VRQNSTDELPCKRAYAFFALRIPKQIFPVAADGYVRVHAAAVDADDRLGQEASRHTHACRYLPANQLVQLNLVGGSHDLAVTVVDFELRRRDLGMIFFVLKTHRTLHFRDRVDERT
jgi:hypothetical protein